jgi:hypothetical protein
LDCGDGGDFDCSAEGGGGDGGEADVLYPSFAGMRELVNMLNTAVRCKSVSTYAWSSTKARIVSSIGVSGLALCR